MKKNILVTGGCGFIGSNFVNHLLKDEPKSRIVNIDKLTYAGNLKNISNIKRKSQYKFIKGDICDFPLIEKIFQEEKIDTVVNFAAESHVDRSIYGPESFIRTNILGTFSLLEGARKYWIGNGNKNLRDTCFLHVSTDEVYGSLGDTGLFSEDTPYDPRSPYSASKASSDHLVSSYFHTYGLPILISNCSNNYGPFQFPEKLIPLTINNAVIGEKIPVYGDGLQIRDWLYVDDHCDALIAIINNGNPGETYNIGGNNEKRNIDVVQKICDGLDNKLGLLDNIYPRRTLITFIKDRPGHDRRYAIDAGKIRKQLGWEPKVNFEEGLNLTLDWYLNHREWMESILNGSYKLYYDELYHNRIS